MSKQLFLSLLLIISLFSFSFSQLPWSQPRLLCDSMGENIQPSFVRFMDGITDYNVLLWSRDFGNFSKIILKDFANPDTEIALNLNPFGDLGYSQNPSGSMISDPVLMLIVCQSNQYGNFDLYSIEYQDGQISNLQQITNNILDDVMPKLMGRYLVWERNNSIYFSSYSNILSSWEPEFLVDSANCSNPSVNVFWGYPELSPVVIYEKNISDSIQIFLRVKENNQSWNDQQNISLIGQNRNPEFSMGIPDPILWACRNSGLSNIKVYSYSDEDTSNIISSRSILGHPCGLLIPLLTDQLFGPMLIAFESDSTGNQEIYANVWPFVYDETYNISQYLGKDCAPDFSAAAWSEATVEDLRYWIAWEREINNEMQIMGSFSEMQAGDLGEKKKITVAGFVLYQNYPNPFNNATQIKYTLSRAGMINLSVYNTLGQKMITLFRGWKTPGTHKILWNGQGDTGHDLASGIYFLQLKAGNFITTCKMIMLR